MGRLVKAKGGPNGNLWSQTYQYDRYGNRTNVTATGVAVDSSPIPIDGIPNLAYDNATNRITTTGYQYDVNGNMVRSLAEDGTTWVKYEYDAANRLNIVRGSTHEWADGSNVWQAHLTQQRILSRRLVQSEPETVLTSGPRQGRAQTVLHELGHTKGILISPEAAGLPNDPNSPGNRNKKKVLDNCGDGLKQIPTT